MNKNKYVELTQEEIDEIMQELNWRQMEEIRLGLEDNLDVSIYAKSEFDWSQMEEIRLGLEDNLDVSVYAKSEFGWRQMREIRLGLSEGLDVSVYAKPEHNMQQMREIRWCLNYKLDSNNPIKTQIKYGFKAFNKDMTCRNFQYEIGKRYTMEEVPECCSQGFHFCLNLEDCYYYYPKESCVICKVEILGDIDTVFEDSKCCTNDIRILERI